MNKRQKEILLLLLSHEKALAKDLKKIYSLALVDVQKRIKKLQSSKQLQSKIYRLRYQRALEKQLKEIINTLNSGNTELINEYLVKAYEDGYLGSMYVVQGEGIPFLFNIDQKRVMTAINKPIEKMTFAKRINTDMDKFKEKIKAEISRGIASNATYQEVAKRIEKRINESFSRSFRIARTEMGRVASEAQFDNLVKAKENGCDIYKEWCATLDFKTRPAHQALDGQKKEIDEPFTYQGHKAMYPRGFGVAALDINCRCALLELPKWADTKEPTERIDNITGKTIKANTYKEWKEKYHSKDSENYIKYTEQLQKKYKSNFKGTLKKMSDKEYEQLLDLCDKLKG